MPVDSNGVPFSGGYIVASGNLAADMYANVMADQPSNPRGATLGDTDDPGMKDMCRISSPATRSPEPVARRPRNHGGPPPGSQ